MAATRKFRDFLTERKQAVHLCPVLWEERAEPFSERDLDRRLLHGGLPEPLLAVCKEPAFFNEWIDSFYARDILELFGLRNRLGFLSLFRLLLQQSGGQLDYSKLANLSELSRPTVKAHIEAMQVAHAVHLVLDTLRVRFADEGIFYWQDKSHREIDFVVRQGRGRVDVMECKINPDNLDENPVESFRSLYPHGENYIISPAVKNLAGCATVTWSLVSVHRGRSGMKPGKHKTARQFRNFIIVRAFMTPR